MIFFIVERILIMFAGKVLAVVDSLSLISRPLKKKITGADAGTN